ncbi:hypothetical protein RCO48_21550 [Peribacillus frigoritolerans]|nr:hypothetical protein [Peribacillus frigoritolerans]
MIYTENLSNSLVSFAVLLVNLHFTRDFERYTREFPLFTREFCCFTREFALFTREFAFS